jgi:hypothetical protein
MIQIKTSIASKIINSKKDFFFYDLSEDNKVTNYILTNDFKRKKEFDSFRVISTIQKENEFITI